MADISSMAVRSAKVRSELSELTGVVLGKPGMAAKNDLFGRLTSEEWLLEVLAGIYKRLDALETVKPTSRRS